MISDPTADSESGPQPASWSAKPLDIRPEPIPHVVIPGRPDLCLTPYLRTDSERMAELYNHPAISPGLATPKVMDFGPDQAAGRIERALTNPRGWQLPALRYTADLAKERPPMMGLIHIQPTDSLPLGDHTKAAMGHTKDLPDEQKYWTMAFLIDPSLGKQGIMTIAARYILHEWFLPTIKPFPGQLTSGYFISNVASERIHARLNFLPVARSALWAGRELKPDDEEVVCVIWQGAGKCSREESIFSSLPTVDTGA